MLENQIDTLFEKNPEDYTHQDMETFQEFKLALNSGQARAAQPDADSPLGWTVNPWVKRGILVGFRMGHTVDMSDDGRFSFFRQIDLSAQEPRRGEQRPGRPWRLEHS